MLVGSHQAMPVLGAPAPPQPRIRKLNQAAARHFVRPDMLDLGMALAASGTGAPLPCTMLDLYIAERLQNGETPDPTRWAAALGR